MPLLLFNLAAVVIASLFYLYRHAHQALGRQRRKLRDRVAFMLWSAAQHSA